MPRLLALSMALVALAPAGAAPRVLPKAALPAPAPRPALTLAERLLAGPSRGRSLVLARIAGLLEEGLSDSDLARAAGSAAVPRALPLAPEQRAELDALLASPYEDGAVFAQLDRLAPALASLAGFLHAENEAFLPYRILLRGSFAEARLGPRDGLEVWLDAAPVGAPRGSREAAETWNGIVAEAMQRFARVEGLELHRYGTTARFLEQHLERPVDLGLGLDLLADPAQALRRHYADALKAHGVLATRTGRVLAVAPVRPRGGYVERHVGELARRFDRLRAVLADPLHLALTATGDDRRIRVAAARQELDQAVDRFAAYLVAWQKNLAILEGMAQKKTLAQTAERLKLPVEALADAAALLASRVHPEDLPGLAAATRSPLAGLVADLRVRLEGYAARYRQALPSGR